MKFKTFARSLMILFATLVAPLGVANADPNQGPGGPILVITNGNQNFGKFYAEILRTEGFNEFAVADIGSVTSTTLNSYDVVIVAKVAVTSTQASMLATWVDGGGNLILNDPPASLASLAGITQTGSTLANGYLLVDNATRAGTAIVNETIQFHGTAQLSSLGSASSLARLYSSATTATAFPAVTLRSVGTNGGQVATFMFDLATSIVYTRQGNPAWATQERDGQGVRRSSDKFYGNAAGDPQPDWVDLTKVAIPQADEQQRFLANLITDMNADRKALPRFWYFPHGYRSALIMTGDDHGFFYTGGATKQRFDQYLAASPAGCSVADWECVRGTSYIFTNSLLTDPDAAAYQAQGFEVGLHAASMVGGNCVDFTLDSLTQLYTEQTAAFFDKFSSVQPLSTMRHHCIVWSDWASGAKVELANGIRLDTTYYFWPAEWVRNTPGHFTGSAMPMRYADLDGTLIDVYQAVTQMTDESGQQYPLTVETLLDRALGAGEQYGAYTVNAHIDTANEIESSGSVTAAQERGVPVISARQMLTWLDGRNGSSFSALSRSGNLLNFTVTRAAAARGLQGMVPWRSANQFVTTLRRNGADVPYEVMTVKGIEYAMFAADTGSYVATYTIDTVAPEVVSHTPTPNATNVAPTTPIRVGFSEALDPATVSSATVELRTAANALVPATISYVSSAQAIRIAPAAALQGSTTYTVTVRGGGSEPRIRDAAGNALAANDSWTFTTKALPTCPCSLWNSSAIPGTTSAVDPDGVELGVKFRAEVNGFIKGIRFYKGPDNSGVHTGTLWSAAGSKLATGTFFNETAIGWQQMLFPTPVPITAGATYIASYYAPQGGYAVDTKFFNTSSLVNGYLEAQAAPDVGGNGMYAYGAGGVAPNQSYDGSNYWVDVVFDIVGGSPADTGTPTVQITAPVNGDTFEATSGALALGGVANDDVGVSQVTWSNSRGGSGTASGTASWSIPTVNLAAGANVITVVAHDFSGKTGGDTLTVNYTPPPDLSAPTVTARTPGPGATDALPSGAVTVAFSEALDAATVSSTTFELRNPSNVLIPATVTYDANTFIATLKPTSPLAVSTVYTVTLRGGAADPRVKDVAGNALAANSSWSFTTLPWDAVSIWPSTAVPGVASDPETASVELGLKFRSDVPGYITGVRFYKGPTNTGVHTGSLWSAAGELLATATFANESATGWQQVLFSTPVQIVANTTYVVSYLSPSGGYSYDAGAFASSGVDSGVLHALSGPSSGGNGVYVYGNGGVLPTSSFNANYWVDVLFASSTGPDTNPPSIVSRTPASGAGNVPVAAQVSVVFNETMNASTINSSTLELRTASNVLIPATVSYSGTTATLVPNAALATSTVYTVTVRGGATDPRVKDAAGNALAANATWSFTTTSSNTTSFWSSTATPAVPSDPENVPVELGVKFRSDVSGFVTGLRFYKGPANTGVHTGTLWSADGNVLSTATFANETATGWQEVLFSSPVAISPNTTYVASYFAPNGGYAYNANFFATTGLDAGVLHMPSSPSSGGNGVYAYAASSVFPTLTVAANYWVDVVFTTSIGPDVNPPVVLTRAPVSGGVNVPTNTPVSIGFNENMTASTINTSTIELRNASNVLVPATVSYSGTTAMLIPSAPLANLTTYTVTVRGGGTDPRVKDLAGNALAANDSWSFTTAAAGGPCAANAITAENCLAGNPASEWDISGAGDPTIQGFATQISVNRGSTIQFKVQTNAANYRLDIYRMGYYGGLGARKVTTVNPSATLPQTQPSCLTQASSGLLDCGNWAVSASWPVPSTATSGIYFAKLVRADTGGASHIVFIVRNDASTSDVVFQTSDTTWQAYNTWGGNSLYVGSPGTNPGRAYKVSYNRPFNTRSVDGGQDWVFNAEYPMVRWLEANGYDLSYITGVDSDRAGNLISAHKTFLSVGHDEYWSGQQRANVEAARAAGVNLAFFSGNEVFWKTRWENSIDSSNTAYRTLVSYKETHASAKIDPSAEWTGTWRDPRFSPPANGGRPENALTGTIFSVNSGTAAIVIPEAEGKMRLWRGTTVASLGTGQFATMPNGTLGYEWDSDLDNGSRPAGLIRLSDTTVNNVEKLMDYGSTYATGTANHALTFYKHSSGARVFGAGTVQWSWGLDANHDRAGTPVDQRMQQATVNLLADLNAQPATLQPGLSTATASTDNTGPTVVINSPAASANLQQVSTVISGTAADAGGAVGAVEVSVDDGVTWRQAVGRANWSYTWSPGVPGPVTIRVRAVDDSGNIGAATTRTVTVAQAACPCSIWPSTTPSVAPDVDPSGPIVLGTRFRSQSSGRITALRFYKDPQNTGTHVGSLWSDSGTLLAQVPFTNESASGWQTQNLTTPVNITANTDYVVAYLTSSGKYTGQDDYFASNGVSSGPLRAPANGEGGENGLYIYSSTTAFPTQTYNSENYWVDVVFNYTSGDGTPPAVTITTPTTNTTHSVTSTPLSLGGTASDAVGVTQVTWTNDRGGSGTATGTTSWSITGIALQSGQNVLTVTARDAAGNTSTDSITVTYTPPDTTPPVVSITSPTSNSTTTVQTTPINIGGTSSDVVGVTQVTWTNDRGGSGTASGTTSWSVTGVALQSGQNVISVTARDAAGNTSSDTLTVTYNPDTTAPAVTITAPTSNATLATQSPSINLGGSASDAVGVTQVTWVNDRGGSGTASGTTSWSVTGIALQTGQNVLTVTARDAAGNTNTDTLTVTYTLDTTAPTVTIMSPTSNATTAVQVTPISMGGTASDAVGITQVNWTNDRGGSGSASGTTNWLVTGIVLQAGQNVLTVTARDAAGNTNTDTLTVTYTPDATAPAISVSSPTSNSTFATSLASMNIGGNASDAVGVTQVTWSNNRGGNGTATGTTTWSVANITLQSGDNILTVSARDAAGNIGTDTLTVTYTPDTVPPVVTITGPTSNDTHTVTSTPLALSGTASDTVGVTQVSWSNSRGGSGNASGTTNWSVGSITLLSGTNIITVTARDAAGNTSTDTLTVTYNPDTTQPAVTITTPTSNSTLTVTTSPLSIGGTATDNVAVTRVTWSNNRGGSGTATGTANWSVSGITLQSGSNIITVTARDAAGNTRTDTLTVTYNPPDITQPSITILTPTSNSTLTTSASSTTMSGTASDNVGVTQVTWSNDRGGSGTASGTTLWSTTSVALQTGQNILTVTARDAAGNTRTDTLTVTRN